MNRKTATAIERALRGPYPQWDPYEKQFELPQTLAAQCARYSGERRDKRVLDIRQVNWLANMDPEDDPVLKRLCLMSLYTWLTEVEQLALMPLDTQVCAEAWLEEDEDVG